MTNAQAVSPATPPNRAPVKVFTNTAAINAQRSLNGTGAQLARSVERMSSGLRINSARDDAAGLAISERMTSQIRGMTQAARNANDGVSLLQTADGALSTLAENLQRVRELAVQASNGSLSTSDRAALNAEAQQLMQEVERVGRSSSFNGDLIFDQGNGSIRGDRNKAAVIDGLKLGWLEEAESKVSRFFGLQADGAAMSIELSSFSDGAGNTAARVVGSGADARGRIGNVRLQIDMADFTPPNLPNGGTAPYYNDRIVAHEVVHAVQYRSLNIASMSLGNGGADTWFLEGMAEFIQGADERVADDITTAGSAAALISGTNLGSWGGGSADYSVAYVAMRYLDDRLKSAGFSGGIKDMLQYMSRNDSTLDQGMTQFLGIDASTFRTQFAAAAVNFINTKMNLTNADTGAVGGADASNGPVRTAESVLLNQGSRYGEQVMSGFRLSWEAVGSGTSSSRSLQVQVGANKGQAIDANIGAVNLQALGIDDLNLTTLPQRAIVQVDDALAYISSQRAAVGAQMSRLEATINGLQRNTENTTASRSRVLDADYAKEAATLVRSQILQQAGVAMVAQANTLPQLALSLLR